MKILLALAAALALAAGHIEPSAATLYQTRQQPQAAPAAAQATPLSGLMDATAPSHRLQRSSAVDLETSCANGVAVPDPRANQGLVQDCVALLAARDALAGEADLNWSADRDIHDWRGIEVVYTFRGLRVVALELPLSGLTGTIPPEIGELALLGELNLRGNRLTGAIPPELGALAMLQALDLEANQLSGAIPSEVGDLEYLEELLLSDNQLTGVVPRPWVPSPF